MQLLNVLEGWPRPGPEHGGYKCISLDMIGSKLGSWGTEDPIVMEFLDELKCFLKSLGLLKSVDTFIDSEVRLKNFEEF